MPDNERDHGHFALAKIVGPDRLIRILYEDPPEVAASLSRTQRSLGRFKPRALRALDIPLELGKFYSVIRIYPNVE